MLCDLREVICSISVGIRAEKVINPVGLIALHRRQKVAVGVQREANLRMSEPLRDYLRVNASAQKLRRAMVNFCSEAANQTPVELDAEWIQRHAAARIMYSDYEIVRAHHGDFDSDTYDRLRSLFNELHLQFVEPGLPAPITSLMPVFAADGSEQGCEVDIDGDR